MLRVHFISALKQSVSQLDLFMVEIVLNLLNGMLHGPHQTIFVRTLFFYSLHHIEMEIERNASTHIYDGNNRLADVA